MDAAAAAGEAHARHAAAGRSVAHHVCQRLPAHGGIEPLRRHAAQRQHDLWRTSVISRSRCSRQNSISFAEGGRSPSPRAAPVRESTCVRLVR